MKLSEIVLLLFILVFFIFIRSINFTYFLNFTQDQAAFSSGALKIYQEKSLRLIGPPTSMNFEGRLVFQGSIIYYFQLLFLILGNFNPIISTYLFMLFSGFMVFPLYFGVKMLIDKKSAWFLVILYCLLPYYIDYTRFLWNPNFQFSLSPILIYLMGLFKKRPSYPLFFMISVYLGSLLQFHYQFLIVIIGISIYYFLIFKLNRYYLALFLSGFCLGFSPLIIFEIRNNFYNTQTLILYFKNIKQVLPAGNSSSFMNHSHYFLTISLFFFIILFSKFSKRLNFQIVFFFFVLLLFLSLFLYIPKPSHAFRMINNWNYSVEEKIYSTISNQNLKDYNITNLSYDSLASVQKYLLKKDNIKINFDDYKTNRYLFVINSDNNFTDNPAYEVNTFKPSKIIKQWLINPFYNLYLLERN